MPIASSSCPKGPYRFIDREFMIITYKSDPDAIRDVLPEPLEPDGSDTVLYELIKMPDSAGFGDYTESGVVIPALFKNEPVNFTAQMYLDMNRRSQEVEKFGASPKTRQPETRGYPRYAYRPTVLR